MNLKSLIAVAAIAATGSALAAYESPVKLCQIKLTTVSTNAIIALPLVNVGSTTANPTNYVLKTGLEENDYLYASYGKNTKVGWKISSEEWEPVTVVVNNETIYPSNSLPRGTGVWLCRHHNNSPVYLYGEISTSNVTSTAAAGSTVNPTYTMMGNPRTSRVDLKTVTWSTDPNPSDMIVFIDDNGTGGMSATYVYKSGEWKQVGTPTNEGDEGGVTYSGPSYVSVSNIYVEPGQGFWYISEGANTPAINWGEGE